jgi:hypothetical protein
MMARNISLLSLTTLHMLPSILSAMQLCQYTIVSNYVSYYFIANWSKGQYNNGIFLLQFANSLLANFAGCCTYRGEIRILLNCCYKFYELVVFFNRENLAIARLPREKRGVL